MTAVLEISDGTTTIDLISRNSGFHLSSWRPTIAALKGGGTYQDSSIAPSRGLVFGVFDTANEVFNLKVNDYDQDALIEEAQELLRLLQKARDYWLAAWQDTPVYIKAQASCETSPRYAIIKNYTLADLDNPYAQPFYGANDLVTMDNLSLGIERGHWHTQAPGTAACAEASSVQAWPYIAEWNAVATADTFHCLLQATSGRIFAGGAAAAGDIYYSDTDGDAWALSTGLPTNPVYALCQTSSGRILSGGLNEIFYTDNNGAAWAATAAAPVGIVQSIIQTTSGRILAADLGQILYSDNDGGAWAAATTAPTFYIYSIIQTRTGRILATEYTAGQIWYSDDDGTTWDIISSAFPGACIKVCQISHNGTRYPDRILASVTIVGVDGQIWGSDNDGTTWKLLQITAGGYSFSFVQDENTLRLYSGQDLFSNLILYSEDDGDSWQTATTVPVGEVRGMIQTTTGRILATDTNQIWELDMDTIDMGRADTCTDETFIANKQNVANITDIYVDNGGAWGANLIPMTVFSIDLLPAAPAVNDAVYFGINTAIINSGPFCSLVFDLDDIISFDNTYTITWEYRQAAAWGALAVRDGTNPGSGVFRQQGVCSVHWVPPSDWTAYDISGAGGPAVTGYWIRARVSALAGNMTAPSQQNRNIYTIVNGYLDVDDADVFGDISALLQAKVRNRSDEDGWAGGTPNLWENRLIVGLRSYNRGITFSAYLNCSDEQNPFSVTVTAGTNVTIGADIVAPSGRSATYNPAGVEAMASRVLFTLSPSAATDYYGTFRAFVRVQRTAGASTDFTIQLQISSGSGGVTTTTNTVQVQTTTVFELLDFGQVQIPAAGSLGLAEMGDQTTIDIQASAASGTPNLIFYDLILIPTDEWSIDAIDKANDTDSVVGRTDDIDRLINIDSITRPKQAIRALVQEVGTARVSSIYNAVTPGEAILQANADQKLWFLTANTSATGSSYYWFSRPEVAHSVQLFKNERYLGLKGAR